MANATAADLMTQVNTIANVSFIWTPYLWPESDEVIIVKAVYAGQS